MIEPGLGRTIDGKGNGMALTRRRMALVTAATLCSFLSFPNAAHAVDPDNVYVGLSRWGSGLDQPVAIAIPNDGSSRIFIVERPGRIRVRVPGSGLRRTPYLSITSRVGDSGTEQGMLGLAFHPNFKNNGYYFVSYTDNNGDLVVVRFRVWPTSNTTDPRNWKLIIKIPHPDQYSNHNGGALAFKGGYLYISTGDGGGGGGPYGYAQNRNSLLGKILRINVDASCGGANYCSPSTNPFYGSEVDGRAEVWMWGLRNPWRISFDKSNGEQWFSDVGQNAREEINRSSASAKGVNYGWDCYEGTLNTSSSYGGSYCSDGRTFTKPVFQYSHSGGRCAIVGGYVYRASEYKSVIGGMYLYADYCTGEIFALIRYSTGSYDNAMVRNHAGNITTFGETPGGSLFVADAQGNLYKVTARAR